MEAHVASKALGFQLRGGAVNNQDDAPWPKRLRPRRLTLLSYFLPLIDLSGSFLFAFMLPMLYK